MKTLAKLLLMLVLLLPAGFSSAQSTDADKGAARQLSLEAQAAYTKGDYKTAAEKFRKADELYHAPTLLVGLARANVKLGNYVEALENYNRVIREKLPPNASTGFVNAVRDAKKEVKGLDEKIGWVTIVVTGPDEPQVSLDDVELKTASLGVKRPVNPGKHVVKAGAKGYLSGDKTFEITAGDNEELTLVLEKDPNASAGGGGGGGEGQPSSGSTLRTIGFVAIGVGGAGLIAGGVTGGLAMGKHGELEDNCPNGVCAAGQQDTLDSYHTLGTISTIGFIAGGVIAATGVVLVLVAPSDAKEPASAKLVPELRIGPGHVQATISF